MMPEVFSLVAAPFVCALAIGALHSYVGLHVLRRQIIFVDIALAQWAALGAAIVIVLGQWLSTHASHARLNSEVAPEIHTSSELDGITQELIYKSDGGDLGVKQWANGSLLKVGDSNEVWHSERLKYALSLLFSFVCAAILTLGRREDERVPHEAVIGMLYVIAAALTILILAKAPHAHERVEAMFVGNLLFASWKAAVRLCVIYGLIALIHYLFRKQLWAVSEGIDSARRAGYRVRLWDALFFVMFALMVTESVSVAGVFVVFSFLVIPPACARLLASSLRAEVIIAQLFSLLMTIGGFALAVAADLPVGASLVVTGGMLFVLSCVLQAIL